MRLTILALSIFLIVFLVIGSDLRGLDDLKGKERDIVNYTESIVDLSITRDRFLNQTLTPIRQNDETVLTTQRLQKSVYYLVYSSLGIVEELVKMTIEFGYKKPLDYDMIFTYLKYILVVILIVALIKPIGYILIFIIMFVLYIRDRIRSRKNKKPQFKKPVKEKPK